jgi:hypothetical protein
MKITHQIDSFTLSIECDEILRPSAEGLLTVLIKLHEQKPQLHDGSIIQFGWSRLRLQQEGEMLCVCEPDFLGNPLKDYIPRVDYTLQVINEQTALLRQLNCTPQYILYSDAILIAKNCLTEPRIYLERRSPSHSDDSGWYIGSTERKAIPPNELSAIRAYQLLKLRPEVMQVLPLSENYLVVFSGKQIEAILDENNNQVWSA